MIPHQLVGIGQIILIDLQAGHSREDDLLISKRLLEVLEEIRGFLKETQYGFMKSRSIFEAVYK